VRCRFYCLESPTRSAKSKAYLNRFLNVDTGVNPAGDAGDTSPNILVGGRQRKYPSILLRTFGYSRPILVALRSLSLEPFSFGYKTPPIRFSPLLHPTPFGGSSPNLELTLTPLNVDMFQSFGGRIPRLPSKHAKYSASRRQCDIVTD